MYFVLVDQERCGHCTADTPLSCVHSWKSSPARVHSCGNRENNICEIRKKLPRFPSLKRHQKHYMINAVSTHLAQGSNSKQEMKWKAPTTANDMCILPSQLTCRRSPVSRSPDNCVKRVFSHPTLLRPEGSTSLGAFSASRVRHVAQWTGVVLI